MDFSPAIEEARALAFAAGKMIARGEFTKSGDVAEEKGDPNVGHHAIVTGNDIGAQNYILDGVLGKFPEARFITEEKAEGFYSKIITDVTLDSLAEIPLVSIIDPLDGSSQCANDLPEWSVSIGVMRNGIHAGGAIYAPMIRGGICVTGERGWGIRIEGPYEKSSHPRPFAESIKKSVVYVGPDIFFLPQYQSFLGEFSKQVRATNATGSCALGLALVATGRVDALIQPVQCPWDWAAGYPLVEEAGGRMLFYHYRNGIPQALRSPDTKSYSSETRNTAFIAGKPEFVDWLWSLLREKWQPLQD